MLQFELKDIPDNFMIRLSDEFVDVLDKLNRPWKYDGSSKQGRNQIWKAKDPFFKKLWGWSRLARRGHDNGAFITIKETTNILQKTNITWWIIEENVIGFKTGYTGNELKTDLPIKPNKWWAKLFGFYWSSGGHYWRIRKDKYLETLLRFNVDDTVVSMLQEIAKHIGDKTHKVKYVPLYKGPKKAKTLRSRVRQPVLFSIATLEVLKKFGIPPVKKRGTGRPMAARNFRVSIPQWIQNDDENMHAFIEGYINGQRGHSIAHSRSPRGLTIQVLIRFLGKPKKQVKKFAEAFRDWFTKHGVTGYFREMPKDKTKVNPKPRYELVLHNKEALTFLFDNFNIQRPDMRARLILLKALPKDAGLYEVMRSLSTQQIVVLGMIKETPRTIEEIKHALRMRPENVIELVASLDHILQLDGTRYHVDLSSFLHKSREAKRKEALKLVAKIKEQIDKLFYQCTNCGRAYTEKTEICEICGSKVKPVERSKILKPLTMRMHRAETKARKLRNSPSFLG